MTCLYLHSLKVSQLEKESQEQRERCKMLSAELENANNLHRTSLKSLKDVLEETVLRWKSFGIPECDVEVHATDSGQFLPPTDLPMTPRDSNNLKAKDVRADGPSDASTTMPTRWCRKRGERRKLEQVKNKLAETQEQCPNSYASAWKTAEEERPEPLISTTASSRRFAGDVESLKKASSTASDMDTQSGAPDVASEPEAKKSSRFLQLITLQDVSAENASEFLPTELFPLLLDFLPVDEVAMFDVRAVSRFFASPKAWVFHLFKLMDIDSLPTLSSEKQMHPVVECFHKCSQAETEEPEIAERWSRLTSEYLLRTSERCRGFLVWMYNLHRWKLYQPDLVHHFIDVCLEGLDYQPGETPSEICWWLASFLHGVYPWPELRLRIARRMMDIAGVAKEQNIVRTILNGLSQLAPVCQCIDRHFLAEFVRIMTSDEALFSPCFFKVSDMADLVLADDLARLVAFRRHLRRAFIKPGMLSEVRHELLELLAG